MADKKVFPGRLVFDHLTKTGGQAINAWLRQTLGDAVVTYAHAGGWHRELIKGFGGRYSVIFAHISFEGDGLDPRYDYATLLRHPLDRALSFIYFILNNHDDQDIVALRRDMKAFVDSDGEEAAHVMSDRIVDHFCAIHNFADARPEARFEHVVGVLQEYAFWGLYERLPDFLQDLANYLQVPAPARISPVNVTRSRPSVDQISPRLRARLEEIFAEDLLIYEWLQTQYDAARQRWQRPAVVTPRWQPLTLPSRPCYDTPDFIVLSVTHRGGVHISQYAVISYTVEFSLAHPCAEIVCAMSIRDGTDRIAFSCDSRQLGAPIGPCAAGRHQVVLAFTPALPEGSYWVDLSFTTVSADTRRVLAELANFDSFLVSLERQTPSCGYVCLPLSLGHTPLGGAPILLITEGAGRIECIDPITRVMADECWWQSVRLFNASGQDWQSTYVHPMYLSYHWYDEAGNLVLFDGLRTPLPGGRLAAGALCEVQVEIAAPATPGRYRLQLLPVCEGHSWFDELGFTPANIPVKVLPHKDRAKIKDKRADAKPAKRRRKKS